MLAEVSYLVFCISWSFHGCLTRSLIKTAMKILRKMRALLVYFHSFCTSVFPTSNLMSSQRPIIFNWLTDQTLSCFPLQFPFFLPLFFYFLPTEVATCSPRLPIFCQVQDFIHLIHKWPPTWDERATKHGIEAFLDKNLFSCKL